MTTWLLIIFMSCDAKGLSTVEMSSKESCTYSGENIIKDEGYWTQCLHYKCVEIRK